MVIPVDATQNCWGTTDPTEVASRTCNATGSPVHPTAQVVPDLAEPVSVVPTRLFLSGLAVRFAMCQAGEVIGYCGADRSNTAAGSARPLGTTV